MALAPALGGCVGVAVVGGLAAAGGAGYEAGQERGLNGAYDDFNIKATIGNSLRSYYGEISSSVYQGRVLLTGTAPTPSHKAQAEQIARSTPGVRAVYDDIEVAAAPESWQTAKDSWITARVRSELMLKTDMR
jgi:osmotically-inducible protein OsmY